MALGANAQREPVHIHPSAQRRTEKQRVSVVPVPLAALLDERDDVWSYLAEERSVSLVVSGDATVLADPDRLAQVLDNLIANALEVAPPGSAVEVVARGISERLAPAPAATAVR